GRPEGGEAGEEVGVVAAPERGAELELVVDRRVVREDQARPPEAPAVPVAPEPGLEVLAPEADHARRDEVVVDVAVLDLGVADARGRLRALVEPGLDDAALVLFDAGFEKDVLADAPGRARAAR